MSDDSTSRQGYQVVQIGPEELEIPVDWEVVTVDDVASRFISGGTPDSDNEDYWGGEIPWTTCAVVEGPQFSGQKDFITQKGLENSSASLAPEGSLLFGTRVNVANVGRTTKEIAISQDLTGVVLDEEHVNPDFVTWYLLYNQSKIRDRYSQGSTIQGMITSDLKSLPLLLPPLPEQHRVADILSTVDEQIQQTEKIITEVNELKRGLMQDFFSGSNSKNTKEVRFGSNLATIPENWTVISLSEVCEKIVDGPHSTPDYAATGVPFVSAGDIENGEINFEDSKRISEEDDQKLRPRVNPRKGDVLLGKVGSGSLGKVCIVDADRKFNIFVQLALLRPKTEYILPEYLGASLQYRQMQQQILDNASGASMQYIGTGAIGDLEIPLPSINEQKKISKVFMNIRQKLREERKQKSKLQELKRGLMQDLLTGKVRTPPDLGDGAATSDT